MGRWVLSIVMLVVLGLAAVRLSGGLGSFAFDADDAKLIEAQATIIDSQVTGRGRYPQFRATISFPLEEGGTYETTTRVLTPWQDEITIYYDPANPAIAVSWLELRLRSAYTSMPVIAGIAILGFGAWMLRKRKQPSP